MHEIEETRRIAQREMGLILPSVEAVIPPQEFVCGRMAVQASSFMREASSFMRVMATWCRRQAVYAYFDQHTANLGRSGERSRNSVST